jgi:hypothetical protein
MSDDNLIDAQALFTRRMERVAEATARRAVIGRARAAVLGAVALAPEAPEPAK